MENTLTIQYTSKEEYKKIERMDGMEKQYYSGLQRDGVMSAADYFQLEEDENCKMLTCTDNEKIIGYILLDFSKKADQIAIIRVMYLVDKKERKEYSRMAVNQLCKFLAEHDMRHARVEVSLEEWENLRFWFRLGFDKIMNMPYNAYLSEEDFASIELDKKLYK